MWAEIPDAKEKAEAQILASTILGSNYEKVILENRIIDIESFRDTYISVQEQIDDNTSMIESYEEKITYYEELKKQWQDITDAYEQSQEDLLAAQFFGADWEKTILEGRTEEITKFKDAYLATQQAIVAAAWESAQAQVDAANYAAQNGGGALPPPTVDLSNIPDDFLATGDEEYETYSFGDRVFNSESERDAYAAEYRKQIDDEKIAAAKSEEEARKVAEAREAAEKAKHERWLEEEKLRKAREAIRGSAFSTYHDGLEKGYVGSKYRKLTDDEMLNLFQKFGNGQLKPGEVPALLKQGELVMTPEQQANIARNMQMLYGESAMTYNNPPQNIHTNNNTTPVVQNINLTLPNVTNNSGYERLEKELKQMQIDALQVANRR